MMKQHRTQQTKVDRFMQLLKEDSPDADAVLKSFTRRDLTLLEKRFPEPRTPLERRAFVALGALIR
jgi:hypothetical protein